MEDIYDNILGQVRIFSGIFFISMKYILASIFLIMGVITLISLKIGGSNKKFVNYQDTRNLDSMKKLKIVSGLMFIVLGAGFLFNYLLLLLYFILPQNGLLGNIILQIANNVDFMDSSFKLLFLELFDYVLAFLSFFTIIGIIYSIYMLLHPRKSDRAKSSIGLLISSLIIGILFGFSNCFRYLL